MRASVIYDRVVVFQSPGSTTYIDMVHKGDVVIITKGFEYSERDWRDKEFVEVITSNHKVGYMTIRALSPIKE